MGLGRIGSGFGAGFGELVGGGTVFAMDFILGLRGEIDDPRHYLDVSSATATRKYTMRRSRPAWLFP